MTEPDDYMAELFSYHDTTYSLRVIVLPENDDLDDHGRPVAPLTVALDPLPITDDSGERARQTAQRLLGEHAFTASRAWVWEWDGEDSCYWVHVVRTGNEASA